MDIYLHISLSLSLSLHTACRAFAPATIWSFFLALPLPPPCNTMYPTLFTDASNSRASDLKSVTIYPRTPQLLLESSRQKLRLWLPGNRTLCPHLHDCPVCLCGASSLSENSQFSRSVLPDNFKSPQTCPDLHTPHSFASHVFITDIQANTGTSAFFEFFKLIWGCSSNKFEGVY